VGDERLVDLNRAGTGLMEIVTEPDMRHVVFHAPRSCRTSIDGNRSAEEAGAFVRKLQSLLRRLRSGDGDMENVLLTSIEALAIADENRVIYGST
jgi:aspartyl-tRNA(Asn)/glutamyl-tRNA(Gln) amidotransferase subunit B